MSLMLHDFIIINATPVSPFIEYYIPLSIWKYTTGKKEKEKNEPIPDHHLRHKHNGLLFHRPNREFNIWIILWSSEHLCSQSELGIFGRPTIPSWGTAACKGGNIRAKPASDRPWCEPCDERSNTRSLSGERSILGVCGDIEDDDGVEEEGGIECCIEVSTMRSEFRDRAFPLRYTPGGILIDLRAGSLSIVGRF